MTNYLFAILFCLVFASCNNSKDVAYNKQMTQSFIYDFKIKYFKLVLKEGFNRSDAIKSVLKQDHSGYGEPILSEEDIQIMDSLVKIDGEEMRRDSVARKRMAEGAQGKHVMDFAVRRYQSKWLDSLAKARCKIFVRNWKEMEKM